MLRAVRRPRILVGALALLVALPLATWQGTAGAAGPQDTTTTLELGRATATYGDTITVTAPVVTDPGGLPVSHGEVTFDAAPTQAALWGGGQQPHVSFGPLVVDGGTAYLEIDTTTLPFLDAQSPGFWVAAEYAPVEGGTSYAASYNPSAADPLYVDLAAQPAGPFSTTTVLAAPGSARVGMPVTLDATVSPSFAAGTVQFSVDGSPVGAPVPVSGGTATRSHTFTAGGPHTVGAVFTPTDPAAFWGSTAGPAVVVVIPQTTTTVTGPTHARRGAPATLSATVSPAAAAGTVSFDVDGEPVGAPAPVEAGTATASHTFTKVGASTVRATFTPADPTAYDGSSATAGLVVTVGKAETSVTISGPDRVTGGAKADFTAIVTPAGVPGKVTFRFEGRNIVHAVVGADGTAVASHRFLKIGASEVTATWKPTDSATYERADAPAHQVHVGLGTTGAEFSDFVSASMASLTYVAPCEEGRGDGPGPDPTLSLFTVLFYVVGVVFDLVRSVFDIINLRYRAIRCGTAGGRAGATETVRGTVACRLTEAGLECPLELPAFSRLTITGALPMPADLAGTGVETEALLSAVDRETGETTPVSTEHTSIRVPHRTALSARLAPVRPGVDSVGRGEPVAYRLVVGNRGIVTANHVRACVSVGRGAGIRRAAGAVVRDGRACWRLPTLAQGEVARRTLTLVAPARKGWLDLAAVVRPRAAQADPVRVAAALPVT